MFKLINVICNLKFSFFSFLITKNNTQSKIITINNPDLNYK